ncbi:DNA/RNA non-specific endonuclease [Flavobacterium flavipallidum]|uniref:DNA/RNA non-specific endonuclease n=1 Tax=Flavobacterium flavipallidum TaxID=3139140 RepID=A0ABU9HLW6_9FLAO
MKNRFFIVLLTFVFGFIVNELSKNLKREIEQNSNIAEADLETKADIQTTNKDWRFFLPKSSTSQIIEHPYYTLSYNEKAEQAEWVAYELKKEYVRNSDFKRPLFIEDPKVQTQSADWRNYKNSGYDKGHLCPAADMEFDINAYNDTFYTSNISPQLHEFNSGIWNRLEQKFRYWAVKHNGLLIVTGGVIKGSLKTIGKEQVVVPNYFYKIALNYSKGNYKIVAFLIPNEKSSKSIFEYVVAVDAIEKLTGIDFFPRLDDKIENDLEKNVNINSWFAQ